MRYYPFCSFRLKFKIFYYFIIIIASLIYSCYIIYFIIKQLGYKFNFKEDNNNYYLQNNNTQFKYKINDDKGKEITIVKLLLPEGSASLEERAILFDKPKNQSIILMWNGLFDDSIIRGCPEWNCKITDNQSLLPEASAVIFGNSYANIERRTGQYFVFYSQESPAYMPLDSPSNFFNMSFGFRMDTPGASPYGFAALLAPESKPNKNKIYEYLTKLIAKKSKPIAWFVSHCSTQSGREWIAKEMQKYINIDIYGECGPLKCSKKENCLQMLDIDYYFYFAAENSLCLDYLTEKIWEQGLGTLSVPIVLKRSFVEHLLPPASFIAVDDYSNIKEFTYYLLNLINKPKEYIQYLTWRFDYISIKMNSNTDPRAEKLFGVCQICKLTQINPRPIITISSPINKWWDNSCYPPGYLINKFKKND